MATPRRRLAYLSGSSIHKPSRVENWSSDKSPAAQEIPAWCRKFQLRLEAAAEQVRQIQEAGEPEEAQLGLGEIKMPEQDPVQSKLQELTQQRVHVVQAFNEVKEITEEEFNAVRQDLEIVDARIGTEKAKIEREVSAVGGQMMIQQAVINEMRQGIVIHPAQDNVIVQDDGEIFQGIHKQIFDGIKRQMDNGLTLLNH